MPTTPHQLIVGFLDSALSSFVSKGQFGTPAHAPMRVRVRPGKFREPDVDGEAVTSRLLSGFGVDVTSVFDAGKLPGAFES